MNPAIPIFFGGVRHLAGWFAQSAPGIGTRRCAVLLCQPIGHEYMCSHRAFRNLARDLAATGFPVLRFDYQGTGDSGEAPAGESLLPAWFESISLAADELRRRSGVDTLAFVGLRFGATLAARAAADRYDVDSLVMWSPCPNGRSFIRQTRMLAMSSAEHPGDLVLEAEGIESAGFYLDAATVADIAGMNMSDGEPYTGTSALIMTRDDAQSEQQLIGLLADAGVDCDEKRYEDHARFMISPLHSVLPTGAMQTIVQWLDAKYPSAHATTGPAPIATELSSDGLTHGIRESAVSFADGRLSGILVEPATASGNPAVVLLNTGADHHVGPHRMYVPLARRWAELGFPVLRFDLTGIGDSESNDALMTNESYPTTALRDIHDAIAFMSEERRHGRVILAGMCSGAYHATHAQDSAVTGVIAVNPPLYYRVGDPIEEDPYHNEVETRRVTRALRNPAKWRRLLSGRVDLRYTVTVLTGRAFVASRAIAAGTRRLLGRTDIERPDVTRLFRDGVAMHLIFSGGDASQIFFERTVSPRIGRFRQREDFTVDVVPGADHTFMPVKWQRALAELMTQRLLQHRSTQPATRTDS
ncbi:MAG: alpha/beta fold hydrolase [Gemmatimonadaceae bacterium]